MAIIINYNMQRIDSFKVNHLLLERGVYVSKIDANITTLDLRMRRPYKDTLLSTTEMHSLEHLLATSLRSGDYANNVVYVGPMGCATGFYVLFKDLSQIQMLNVLKQAFFNVIEFKEMPGNSLAECGNCNSLCLTTGIQLAKEYNSLLQTTNVFDKYPE